MLIKAINSSEQEVGRNVKSSKKKYIWKFSIDNVDQEIVLLISSLSGKKEVRYNGRPIHQESSLFCDFRYLYKIQNCLVTIAPRYESYQLYLNNIPFAEYFNTRNINQTENPKNCTLNNDDHDEYDLSPLKDVEPQKTNFQQPLQKFKVTVPNHQTNYIQNKTESKQQEILWKQGFNKDFANFGTTSTNGTDNQFGNFGFTFDTPQKEPKNTITSQQNNQKQIEKPNPFFEFGQNSWSAQSKNTLNQQPFQSQQTKQYHSDIKPQINTEQQFNNMNMSQTINQSNQNQQFNQYNLSNQQQQQQQQQQSQQQQQQQLVYSQTINPQKQQILSQGNILDFFESNQHQKNNINFQLQQQQLNKSHSQSFIMPLFSQSQITSMNFQNQQNSIQQNAFQNLQNNQFQSYYNNQTQFQYPIYRTSQSLTPLTSSYQETKKQMPKELEDIFDQPMQNTQPPLQKRSTPFDDDLFT
ncbi:unnamed protein product [Paramecium primaurelia]|uniref:Uncharacterized protein n=1 Tax=Paramecium primaurelia TaxID=5886 RepID=A0A8S1QAH2_PARPR|nr:unnamed protein product [Paramecium primaurelia]